MNLGMSEVVKKQFIHFLRENGANIPDMAEISVPVMPLDFSKYFLHAYLRPDESQMEYALITVVSKCIATIMRIT